MKNLKSKIRDFLASEEGRVGVKTPLALGVAAGWAHACPISSFYSRCSSRRVQQ